MQGYETVFWIYLSNYFEIIVHSNCSPHNKSRYKSVGYQYNNIQEKTTVVARHGAQALVIFEVMVKVNLTYIALLWGCFK